MTELVIFDCDGVLIDSDRISLRVQAEMLCELGVPTSYDACVRDFIGIGMPATLVAITARLGRPLPPSWIDELDQAVRTALSVPARTLRRRTRSVYGRIMYRGGAQTELDRNSLLGPLESALRAVAYGLVTLAVAMVASRL